MRIVCTPGFCAGAPRVRDTRINVYNVVSSLDNESVVDFLLDFPQLERADLVAAIEYCRRLQCAVDRPEHYCDGCSLRTRQEGLSFEEFLRDSGGVETTDTGWTNLEGSKFVGSMQELRKQWEGEDGWAVAQTLYEELYGELDFDSETEPKDDELG